MLVPNTNNNNKGSEIILAYTVFDNQLANQVWMIPIIHYYLQQNMETLKESNKKLIYVAKALRQSKMISEGKNYQHLLKLYVTKEMNLISGQLFI